MTISWGVQIECRIVATNAQADQVQVELVALLILVLIRPVTIRFKWIRILEPRSARHSEPNAQPVSEVAERKAVDGKNGKDGTISMIKIRYILMAVGILITSGCSTAFVRSKSTITPEHAFPATTFDARFLWDAGIKGEPLFAKHGPLLPKTEQSKKSNPMARVVYVVGSIVDLPFSITSDTILVPLDLSRSGASTKNKDTQGATNVR